MAQYLVLLYENESSYAEADKAVWDEVLAEHTKFRAKAGDAIKGGDVLQSTSTATTILSDRAGGFIVTDGPFVETKEALGGYYLIEAPDLDAAVGLAKQVPARFGGVEVRPILTFDRA